MSTITYTVAPDISNATTTYNWMRKMSLAMATFGWVQAADTGQVVWPVSVINITSITAANPTATFTYTLTGGVPLRVGNSILVTGATTAGNNGTYTILTIPTNNTFTAATALTNGPSSETGNHCFAGVNVQISISNALGNGSSNTYTYTNLDGTLINGQSVVITGCSTSGFNGTFTVASISAGTFTTTTGISHASEAETATGIVTANATATTVSVDNRTATSIPSTNNTSNLFEIWKMGDTLQSTFPVFFRLSLGVSNNGGPNVFVGIAHSTDGAGNLTGANTGNQSASNGANSVNQSTTAFPCYLSGDINRVLMALWENQTSAGKGTFFSIERSHSTAGADTAEYATQITIGGGQAAAPVITQISMNLSTNTTSESRLAVINKTGTTTGSFGNSVWLSPVFPVVGQIGNPMIGVLVGKAADWADQTQFSFTLYNLAHNYQVCNASGVNGAGFLTYDGGSTSVLIYRYE